MAAKSAKRGWKVLALVAAAPVALFLLLAVAVYLPPVQQWVKREACQRLSQATGTDITVDYVRLAFPLDLTLNGATAVQHADTLLHVRSLRLGIRVWPLLQRKVELSGFQLLQAQVDTKDFISDTRVRGRLDELSVDIPACYRLDSQSLTLGTALLRRADVAVQLSDTAQEDTTASEPSHMRISLGKVQVDDVAFRLHLPGDSMRVGGNLLQAAAQDVLVDLGRPLYRVGGLQVMGNGLSYDVPWEKHTVGLDYNHLRLDSLRLQADSVEYDQGRMSINLRQLAFSEQSGLRMEEISGVLRSDDRTVRLSSFLMRTPHSQLAAQGRVDWDALENGKGGNMDVTAQGSVGYDDLLLLAGSAAPDLRSYVPKGQPVLLKAHVTGNVDRAEVKELEARLGNAVAFTAKGTLADIRQDDMRAVKLQYKVKTGDMAFYRKILPDGLRIPPRFLLGGELSLNGSTVGTNTTLREGDGWLSVKGNYNMNTENYAAKVVAQRFPLQSYLPEWALSPLTAQAEAQGRGFDFLDKHARLNAQVRIQQLSLDSIPLDSIQVAAVLQAGQLQGSLKSNNRMLTANTDFQASLGAVVEGSLVGNVENLDLLTLTRGADSSRLMMEIRAKGYAAQDGSKMGVSGGLQHVNIVTPNNGYPADNVNFEFATAQDSTVARLLSGDLSLRLQSQTALGVITDSLAQVVRTLERQIKEARLDHQELKSHLPELVLRLSAGKNNPVSRLLHYRGYDFNNLSLDLNADRTSGLNGLFGLWSFKTGALLLDKITAQVKQDTGGLRLEGLVENTSKKNPNKFTASVNGEVLRDGFSVLTIYRDSKKKEGVHLGVKGSLAASGDVTLQLFPEESTIAYRKFRINKDNYVTITPRGFVLADVDLLADDQTGLKVNATQQDSLNDITVSLSHVNLDELCSVLPYLPSMGGFLNGDLHIERRDTALSASGTLLMDDFRYENYSMGAFGAELVYLPKGTNEHYVNAIVLNDNREVASFDGTYLNEDAGRLDATVVLEKFPCHLLNAFLPNDGSVALGGYANGELGIAGAIGSLEFNGSLLPDSMRILSPLYGVDLRMADKPLPIKASCIYMDSLMLYSAKSPNPLLMDGKVNFSDLDRITLDVAFKAKNFQIVNSARTKEAVLFGKVFTDIDATLKGTTNFMIVKGNLKVLGNTDMTYVMKDTPLSVEDRLSGLVEFVDFADSTSEKTESVSAGNMLMTLSVNISEAAKMHCELSADGDSYFDCQGGGNLTMKYLPSGDISLLGRFSMSKGEMKYELPFIPLKTFTLSGDNYIQFTGNPYNPTLHITAIEKTRASVNDNGVNTRMVSFNVGVAITQTLENMGLQFLIEAPEDLSVQNDLASMSEEDRGKLAVTMLATGMYLISSNKSSFKANNALNSFLQSEIQNIAGNALKTIDLTVGVEGSTTASGNAQTNYSFQFAKHLWNDRVTFIIGGKVSAGSENSSENQSFIDNITLEYRLDESGSRNLRVFYDHDTQDPLEGTYSSAGVGLVLRRKTAHFGDLFIWRPQRKNAKVLPTKQP